VREISYENDFELHENKPCLETIIGDNWELLLKKSTTVTINQRCFINILVLVSAGVNNSKALKCKVHKVGIHDLATSPCN